ncbi:MAG: ankyrin repeat domain-containing protein [Bdellovibrionaceae bacterium]|nr:ankyrin repeat domain-containing protein [Pseudobdellovibrionaceae bacterium]
MSYRLIIVVMMITYCYSEDLYADRGSECSQILEAIESGILPISRKSQELHKYRAETSYKPIEFNTEIEDLDTFGEALTKGVRLTSKKHQTLFEVYRATKFGRADTYINGKTLADVQEILKNHPELSKPEFREYQVSTVLREYNPPEILKSFTEGLIRSASQLKSNLFEAHSNLEFWMELTNYKYIELPERPKLDSLHEQIKSEEIKVNPNQKIISELKEQMKSLRNEYSKKLQKRKAIFLRFMRRYLFSQADIAFLRKKEVSAHEKAKLIYKVLDRIYKYLENKEQDAGDNSNNSDNSNNVEDKTKHIRQVMADLVGVVGLFNPAIVLQLKSTSGLERLKGLRSLLAEADELSMELGFDGHYTELLKNLNVPNPSFYLEDPKIVEVLKEISSAKNTNNDKNKSYQMLSFDTKMLFLQEYLEAETYKQDYQEVPIDNLRVRALSIEEAPFRSCLGGGDCSSRTYFEKALDPNFNYFTITDTNHRSSGHATVVLGSAKFVNPDTKETEGLNIAFLDKLQNVPNEQIPFFLEAVARSLKDNGYYLGIPKDLGDHNGLSNESPTREFVYREILPKLNYEAKGFRVHPNSYEFKNEYSRAYDQLELKIYESLPQKQETQIKPGPIYKQKPLDADVEPQQLAQGFLKLKDSENEDDLLRFIKGGAFVNILSKFGIYSKDEYLKELSKIINDPNRTFKLRKQSYFALCLDRGELLSKFDFTKPEKQMIYSEIKSWGNSNDSRKKEFLKKMKETLFRELKYENTNIEKVKEILSIMDIDAQDLEGNTALMCAVRNGSSETVKLLLLTYGASVDIQSKDGNTALMLAVQFRNTEVVELLLAHGASVDIQYEDGKTALIFAALEENIEIVVDLLLAHGASVDVQDADGKTALMLAAMKGSEQTIKLLLAHGASVDVQDKDGNTALMSAAWKGRTQTIKLLLAHGASVDIPDKDGNTVLMKAARDRSTNLVKIFLAHGAKVNAKNKLGNTALLWPALYGYKELVKLLIDYGANIDALDIEGNTLLMTAAKSRKFVSLELLLSHGAIVDLPDKLGNTALIWAARYGNEDIVNILLEHSANIDAQDKEGKTSLMWAAQNRFSNLVGLLLAQGAKVDIQDIEGLTALMNAVQIGKAEKVSSLLSHGASVDIQSFDGNTALMFAVQFGHIEIIKILLDHGANVDITDKQGRTVRQMTKDPSIIELLRSAGE